MLGIRYLWLMLGGAAILSDGIEGSFAQDITREMRSSPQSSQFQLPQPSPGGGAPVQQLPSRLVYEYGYGSESEITYQIDRDLNDRVQDDSLILIPQVNGYVTYRPTDWLDLTGEIILEREIPLREEDVIALPDGGVEVAESRRFSLAVDQAFATLKGFIDPFEVSVGRRNFEDERHWLYDTSIDAASIAFRGDVRVQATAGRERLVDLDLFGAETKDRINTFMLYSDYRRFEDITLAGYAIYRDDQAVGGEGSPVHLGLRSRGNPNVNLSYWLELGYLLGDDDASRDFSAHAIDAGITYRFGQLPLKPNITIGYARATGDRNPDDNENNEFRQTGLQSNETKFAGVSEFKVYGEALDPELSNLQIFTVGLGIRPVPDLSVDFVYHNYRLVEIAEELRNAGVTALMNQDEAKLSKDVGNGLDIVIGVRNLFGVRRLGLDLRGGILFPGDAFDIRLGGEEDSAFRSADKAISVIVKFWW